MIKIMDYSKTSNEEIFYRGMAASGVEDIVAEIISDVRKNKDAALFKYCKKFDNTDTDKLEVTQEEIDEAFASVDPHFIEVIKKARENIYNYHKHQVKNSFIISETTGLYSGRKLRLLKEREFMSPEVRRLIRLQYL